MSTTGLDVFDQTVKKTNEWLDRIGQELGTDDRHRAYLALRGTLHALRDYLIPEEAVHLAAQLPMLVRGIYFEGWNPSKAPAEPRDRKDFLSRASDPLRQAFWNKEQAVEPERAVRAVLSVLARHVSDGEFDQVRQLMPKEVRELWPPLPPPTGTDVAAAEAG